VDLTPLIDVLFMLIIFFVLTAAFVRGEVDVQLPEGQGNPVSETPIILAVHEDGTLAWEGEPLVLDEIIPRAREAYLEGQSILLAGDRLVPYGVVATLLDQLRTHGVERVNLALGGETP
jgi:biopolymer transport protein ExbD